MKLDDIWDWTFMWQMFRNFAATGSPFVMIIVAVSLAGTLLLFIASLVRNKGKP